MHIKILVIFFFLFAILVIPPSLQSQSNNLEAEEYLDWTIYQNIDYGVFFRYPNNMTIREHDPKKFGLPALRFVVDLVLKEEPDAIILRFMVSERINTPLVQVPDAKYLQKTCKLYKEFILGKYNVSKCIWHGSAARHWTIYYFGKYLHETFTLVAEESNADGPRDSVYPILSIMRSMRYENSN